MEWTDQDTAYFASLVNDVEDDNSKLKKEIKEKIIGNKYILKALDNKELEEAEAEPDEYFGHSVLPYYIVHPTQVQANNFICFETSYEKRRYDTDPTKKNLNIIFYLISEQKLIKDADTGIAKHDLLAALIINKFDWTNYFGKKIHLISDQPSVVDVKYACRTLIFEQISDNNLVKSALRPYGEYVADTANKDVVY